jgi:hypothetical protein
VKKYSSYIAGPMTGYKDYNFPAFYAKAAEERAKGYDVINPAELDDLDGDLTQPWDFYLRRDLVVLAECNRIVLLDGWEKSKGACLEVHIGKKLGFEIVYPSGYKRSYLPAGAKGLEQHRAQELVPA